MRTPALDRALSWADGQVRHGTLTVGREGDDDDHGSLLGDLVGCVEHCLVVPPGELSPELEPLAVALAAEAGRRAAARKPGEALSHTDYLTAVVIPAVDAGTIARVELAAWRQALIERPVGQSDPRVAAFVRASAKTLAPTTARTRRSSPRTGATRSGPRPPRP